MGDHLWPQLRELPYFRALLRAVEARLMQEATLPAPVLDIGSGDGHFASVVFDRKIDVGIDPALEPIHEAKRRGAYKFLVLAEGERLPCAKGSFASAVSNSVLEHVDHLEEVLSDISRVLQPGAPLVFTVPNPGYRSQLSIPHILHRLGLKRLATAYEDWFMKVTRTKTLFEEEQWKSLLERVGFRVERSQRYFSPAALRTLEWGHYFGIPCYLPRWFVGRWILVPTRWNLWLTDRLIRHHFDEPYSDEGTYTFYIAIKQ